MQKRLASEHGRELLRDTLEQLLDSRRVADECRAHLQSPWRDIAHSSLHIVRDPLHKVRRVLVLHVQHLLVHFFHGHAAAENGGNGQVAAVARVTGSHHVLGIEHLLGELRHSERAVLLRTTRSEWSESGHEEVQTREGHHVDGELS